MAPSYFIAAGEHSGEMLGADLYLALQEKLPQFNAFGIVGDLMKRSGVEEVASINELGVMGITDVMRKVPQLRMLESEIVTQIERKQPRFAVLIDNPGFHIRLGEQLRLRRIKVFQYVAPKLWAWGENRIPKVKAAFDEILGILPFEAAFFQDRQIPYTYVGCPIKDRTDKVMVTRETLGIPKDRVVIACLPGSRPSEIALNLPLIKDMATEILKKIPNALFLVPMATNLGEDCFAQAIGCLSLNLWQDHRETIGVLHSTNGSFCMVKGMSLESLAAADAAIVASGTATLECALLGTPMVVVYRMSDLTYQVAKKAVKIPYVSLVNLILETEVVKEFIQDFHVEEAAAEIVKLIQVKSVRKAMLDRFEDLRDSLDGNAAAVAAERIRKVMDPQNSSAPRNKSVRSSG
jgi:lipid-A-disaccharide synthase